MLTCAFSSELQSYTRHIRPPPMSQVLLFFEEEDTEPQRPGRTLTVQVIHFETQNHSFIFELDMNPYAPTGH